jgi:hypothetical protein
LAEQQKSAMEIKEGEPGMEAELAAAQLPLPNQQYDPLCLYSNRITRSNKQTNKQTTAIDLRIHNHQLIF